MRHESQPQANVINGAAREITESEKVICGE